MKNLLIEPFHLTSSGLHELPILLIIIITLSIFSGEIHGTLHRKVMEDFQTELAPGAGLILKHVSMVLLYTMYTVYLINQVLGLYWEKNNPRFWQFSLTSIARFGKKKQT